MSPLLVLCRLAHAGPVPFREHAPSGTEPVLDWAVFVLFTLSLLGFVAASSWWARRRDRLDAGRTP